MAIKHFSQTGLDKSNRLDLWIAGGGWKEEKTLQNFSQVDLHLMSLLKVQSGRTALNF